MFCKVWLSWLILTLMGKVTLWCIHVCMCEKCVKWGERPKPAKKGRFHFLFYLLKKNDCHKLVKLYFFFVCLIVNVDTPQYNYKMCVPLTHMWHGSVQLLHNTQGVVYGSGTILVGNLYQQSFNHKHNPLTIRPVSLKVSGDPQLLHVSAPFQLPGNWEGAKTCSAWVSLATWETLH